MVGYTLDEIRELYNRNRYKRDVWGRMHDFAPALTKEELEKIVGETRAEQYEERKKKAVSMRASGAKPEEIAATIDMSVNTVKNLAAKWEKEYANLTVRTAFSGENASGTGMAQSGDAIPGDRTAFSGENASADQEALQETEEEKEMFTGIRPHPEVKVDIPPVPDTSRKAEAAETPQAGKEQAEKEQAEKEQAEKEQAEERQVLYRKIEELERRNESLKEAVTSAEARYNAAAQGQMAALDEVKKLTAANLTVHTASPAGMAQGGSTLEQKVPTVRELIREAMELISGGTLGDGERISIETTNMGTTVLIEKLP